MLIKKKFDLMSTEELFPFSDTCLNDELYLRKTNTVLPKELIFPHDGNLKSMICHNSQQEVKWPSLA